MNTPGLASLAAKGRIPIQFLELGGRAYIWLVSPRSQRRLLAETKVR